MSSNCEPEVIDGKLYGQDFKSLRKECLKNGKLFVDTKFLPEDKSLFFSKKIPKGLKWKRPSELTNNPQLFVDEASRFDVKQGELGDCWLLAALANLTLQNKFLFKVVPKDQSFSEDYAGIFHFRFWQYGEWVDVVIDDYLPTRDDQLLFLHSESKSEFWTALLEKAYAKLHGSYESLDGGSTSEAMVDFTGGCSEIISLLEAERPKDLVKLILKSYKQSSLMGCSITPDPTVVEAKTSVGLVKGHAYSITKALTAEVQTPKIAGKVPLLRIRNPWGNETEWNGQWSDNSSEWKSIKNEEKKNIGLTFETDGEFFMNCEDFQKYFDTLEICHTSAEDFEEDETPSKWSIKTFHGKWVTGVSAGGCINDVVSFSKNPQYWISVTDPDDDEDDLCTVVISLMQKGRRALRKKGLDLLAIGFIIYRIAKPEKTTTPLDSKFFKTSYPVGDSKNFVNLREVTARLRLSPGTYVIVPSTFSPNQDGEFILRVFSEQPVAAEDDK